MGGALSLPVGQVSSIVSIEQHTGRWSEWLFGFSSMTHADLIEWRKLLWTIIMMWSIVDVVPWASLTYVCDSTLRLSCR